MILEESSTLKSERRSSREDRSCDRLHLERRSSGRSIQPSAAFVRCVCSRCLLVVLLSSLFAAAVFALVAVDVLPLSSTDGACRLLFGGFLENKIDDRKSFLNSCMLLQMLLV